MDNPFEELLSEIRELKTIVLADNSNKSTDLYPVYLKIDKAAAFISTSVPSLRQMAHRNQVRYIKKQGRLFFRVSDLIEWIESGSINIPIDTPENILLINKNGFNHERSKP